MTRLAAIAGVAGALALQGCATSGMQFYDYPRQADATASVDECEGMASALKANPAFTDFGPFSLDVHDGFDSASTLLSDEIRKRRALVAKAFPELAPSTAGELGTTLTTRKSGRFLAFCPWDRWGLAFETPHNPAVVGHVELPPPALSVDGRWLLVTGGISLKEPLEPPQETGERFKLDEFSCLLERMPSGWRLTRCEPTSLER